MNLSAFGLGSAGVLLLLVALSRQESPPATINLKPQKSLDNHLRRNISEEMESVSQSLEDLLGELTLIKREAIGRLALVKNSLEPSSEATSDQERIRQTKVSRFVLRRVGELERESLSMRDELTKLLNLSPNKPTTKLEGRLQQQQDLDFDELPPSTNNHNNDLPNGSSTTTTTSASGSSQPATSSTTSAPSTGTPAMDAEAAKLGFDLEALKKMGEEIGKRLDQFGKDTAKNINDLIEGLKLVFREPARRPALATQVGLAEPTAIS